MPQELKAGTAYMVAGLGISMAAGFGAQIVASRALGPEIYGLYGLVVANVALVTGLLSPGLSGAMATFVAERDALKDQKGVSQVVRDGLLIEALLAVLFVGILLWQADRITAGFFAGTRWLLPIFVVLTILEGFYGLLAGVVQGLRELKHLALIRITQQLTFLALIGLLVGGLARGLTGALTAQTLASGAALGLSLFFIRKFFRTSGRQLARTVGNDATRYFREILTFSVPVSLAAVATSLIQNSGPALMSALFAEQVGPQLGILVLLFRLGRMLDRLLRTVFRSAFPYFSRWRALGDTKKLQRYVLQMSLVLSGGYLGLVTIAYLAGPRLISLTFGQDYLPAAYYLPLALLAFWAVSVQDIFRIALFSLKATGQFLLINLSGTAIYFLVIVLMKNQGAAGDVVRLIFLAIIISNVVIIIGAIFLFRNTLKNVASSTPGVV